MPILHNRIALFRAERGMSRRELADAVGVNPQTIGYLERGDYAPSLELGMKIREAAELVSDVTEVFRNLIMDVRDSYRRELCYVRGPGAKWRRRHPRR